MGDVCIHRYKIRWCLQEQNLARGFVTGLKPGEYSHKRGLRRLYCGPRIRMICPTIMKLAARINVGAMMVVVILGIGYMRVTNRKRGGTNCVKYGSIEVGFLLPHNLPLQPMISDMPHVTTVGSNHHILLRRAWTR